MAKWVEILRRLCTLQRHIFRYHNPIGSISNGPGKLRPQ